MGSGLKAFLQEPVSGVRLEADDLAVGVPALGAQQVEKGGHGPGRVLEMGLVLGREGAGPQRGTQGAGVDAVDPDSKFFQGDHAMLAEAA